MHHYSKRSAVSIAQDLVALYCCMCQVGEQLAYHWQSLHRECVCTVSNYHKIIYIHHSRIPETFVNILRKNL